MVYTMNLIDSNFLAKGLFRFYNSSPSSSFLLSFVTQSFISIFLSIYPFFIHLFFFHYLEIYYYYNYNYYYHKKGFIIGKKRKYVFPNSTEMR